MTIIHYSALINISDMQNMNYILRFFDSVHI